MLPTTGMKPSSPATMLSSPISRLESISARFMANMTAIPAMNMRPTSGRTRSHTSLTGSASPCQRIVNIIANAAHAQGSRNRSVAYDISEESEESACMRPIIIVAQSPA